MTDTGNQQRDFAMEVVRQLRDAGYEALWAGGCVRDLLLNRVPDDYDVATNAHPEEVRTVFGKRRTLAIGASFGVIVVLPVKKSAGQVEVATFRSDGQYVDGRRPESVIFSSAEEDAQRRDFTINGMFYDPIAEKVIDFVGGETDLAGGFLRAIGDPTARMTEDKLRMLRAVRFTSTLGFKLEPQTADAIRSMAGQLNVVSAERISQELKKMLTGPDPALAIRLTDDVDLLRSILPELQSERALNQTVDMLRSLDAPSFGLAAAVLFHSLEQESVAIVCRRLRLSNHETDAICWLVQHIDALENAASLPLSQLKRLLTCRDSRDLLALVRARQLAASNSASDVDFCETFLRETATEIINPQPLITGNDLIQMGLQPGQQFKQIIDAVRDEQLNERISTQNQALAFAREIIDQTSD
jgi:poly(A) polymerase